MSYDATCTGQFTIDKPHWYLDSPTQLRCSVVVGTLMLMDSVNVSVLMQYLSLMCRATSSFSAFHTNIHQCMYYIYRTQLYIHHYAQIDWKNGLKLYS